MAKYDYSKHGRYSLRGDDLRLWGQCYSRACENTRDDNWLSERLNFPSFPESHFTDESVYAGAWDYYEKIKSKR